MVETVRGGTGSGEVPGAVVRAVATEVGEPPAELSAPLYEAVDPDALDSLVRSCCGAHLEVCFRYHGCTVTVDGTGRVTATCGNS